VLVLKIIPLRKDWGFSLREDY